MMNFRHTVAGRDWMRMLIFWHATLCIKLRGIQMIYCAFNLDVVGACRTERPGSASSHCR